MPRVADLPTLAQCYTADEVAAALRFTPRTVRAMAARGEIRPAYQVAGDLRIPPHAIVAGRGRAPSFRISDLRQVGA